MGRTFKDIQEDAIKRYRVKINTDSDCWSRMHAHIKTRTVCKWKPSNGIKATFDLLHEIGHIETTKAWMRRCEEEYYATQWAIDRCKEYGLTIPERIIEVYQRYIDDERGRGIRRHCNNLPTTEDLKLAV